MTPSARDDWDHHWAEYGNSAEDNPAQRYRRELIISLLELSGSGEGVRLLDVGSGQGDLVEQLAGRFPSAVIVGLELSQSGVDIACRKVPAARFVQHNLLARVPPPDSLAGWATHAVCSEVLEHVDDPALLLKNARQFMAPNCTLVITVPGGPISAFDRHIGHRKHWHYTELDALLRQVGFAPLYVSGVGFPFFNLYRCLVILRGKRIIRDVGSGSMNVPSVPARAVMAVFHHLLRVNLNSSRRGWQVVAKARR